MTKLLLSALLLALLGLLIPATPAHAAAVVNDYPTAYKNQTNTYAIDRWGFTQRQCVSFVAWRMERDRHPINQSTGKWGSAHNWDNAAYALRKRVTYTPKIGAVAHWNAGEASTYYSNGRVVGKIKAGAYGHVAYVQYVYGDGSVRIEQYNMGGDRLYSVMRVKAPRYIYVA